MFTKIFVFIVFVVIVVSGAPPEIKNPSDSYSLSSAVRRCHSRYEEWNECGPSCPPSCDDLFNPDPKFCTAQCVPSCVCKQGYVRNQWNNCVPPEKCRDPKKSSVQE